MSDRLTFLHARHLLLLLILPVILLSLTGCTPPQVTQELFSVTIQVDGARRSVQVPAGSTVQTAIEKANLQLGNLDRVDPPSFSVLTSGAVVTIIRVKETFEVEETVVPFERQTVRNESLPEGQTLLIQPGVNGIQQITYRQVLEDNKETSRSVFKVVNVTEPRSEIVMVGVQSPFAAVPIEGRIAYLTAGNAWVIEKSTGERRPVVTTGDLDGRVFQLSSDGSWLLYTRQSKDNPEVEINSLWAVDVTRQEPAPIDLKVKNIVHFASWVPQAPFYITYSTVEPRSTAPGWQANNDLQLIQITPAGKVAKKEEIIEANSGGIYGWWGTNFAWSPDGSALAYARPDSVGLVDIKEKTLVPVSNILPFQTRSDWAWVPAISWSPEARLLFVSQHMEVSGLTNPEESPLFSLGAVVVESQQAISLVPQTGMFAYPVASPIHPDGNYQVAYLQAIFPEQSETSRYHLVLMDRDGSNRQVLFPNEGAAGMEPQQVVWGPGSSSDSLYDMAFLYQNNLWLINTKSGKFQQVTGDGLISHLDWK